MIFLRYNFLYGYHNNFMELIQIFTYGMFLSISWTYILKSYYYSFLTLCLLSNSATFLSSADFFLKSTNSKNSFENTI